MRTRTRENQLETYQHVTAMLTQAKQALDVGLLSATDLKDREKELIRMQRVTSAEPGAFILATFAINMHDYAVAFRKQELDFADFSKQLTKLLADPVKFYKVLMDGISPKKQRQRRWLS